jgi:hypothetical protein
MERGSMIERRQRPRPENMTHGQTFLARVMSLILYSDTTPTRFLLAFAASAWAVLLFMPGDTMSRPVYRLMAEAVGSNAETKWAILWTIHAAGMWWRTFSSVPRPWMALAIHSLGVLLFCGSCISIYATLPYPVPAAIASDFVFAVASFWVLVRTSINSEHGWRVD